MGARAELIFILWSFFVVLWRADFAWRVERVGAQARRMGSLEFTPGIENLNKPIEE